MSVSGKRVLPASERTHEHKKRRLRYMEVRKQCIHYFKLESRTDEKAGLSQKSRGRDPGTWFRRMQGRRFKRSNDRRTHGHHAAASPGNGSTATEAALLTSTDSVTGSPTR